MTPQYGYRPGNPTPQRASSAAWGWYVAGGALIALAYYLLPLTGLDPKWQNIPVAGGAMYGTLGVLGGVLRNRPPSPFPWLLLAAAQFVYTIADSMYFYTHTLQGSEAYPDLADVFYLLQYPLIGWALVVLVRRRTPGWHGGAFVDAAVVAIAAGLLWWIYLVGPMVDGSGASNLAGVVSIAYPVMDLLVLTIALRLLFGGGARTTSFRLLAISLVFMLAADMFYAGAQAADAYSDGSWIDGLWIISYTLLGAAAMHPSMRWVDRRAPAGAPMASSRRLLALAAAGVLPCLLLFVQYVRDEPIDAPIIAVAGTVLFVLMLVRMRGLVTVQRRLAITDDLTGLHARDLMEELLRIEVSRAERAHGDVGVLVIDADHFTLVNETYGHAAGDRVLNELAVRVRASSRPGDIVGRDDGDRLLVILPAVGSRQLARLAEDLRERVSATPIVFDDARVRLTVSVGMASVPSDTVRVDELIPLAERAVEAAKDAGRNRTAGRLGQVNLEMLANQMITGDR